MVHQELSIRARQSVPERDGAAVLVITTDVRDRLFMTAALEALRWKLHFAQDGSEARALLAAQSIPVVIMDSDAQAPSWRELLEQMPEAEASPGPKFIVVSRQADERLWAEVLNLGGYDLLPKPLDVDEVTRVIRTALWEGNVTHGPARPAEIKEQFACNGC